MQRIAVSILVAAVCAVSATGGAVAQTGPTFPAKPVRLLLGSPPGGRLALFPRLVAERMSAPLGQRVIVENRVGASGIIAVDAVVKSPADGYNIVMLTSPALLNGLLNGRDWKPAE